MPPDTKLFARDVRTSAQNVATGAGIVPPPPPPAENFLASSLLIWRSGLSFCVAATNERTGELSGAFFSFSKFAGDGLDGKSVCRNTFNSRCLVGSHLRNASICCAGAPGVT